MKLTPKHTPKMGQTRCVRRFAWLPTALHDGQMIWLERYHSHEEWDLVPRFDGLMHYCVEGWNVVERRQEPAPKEI